MQIRKMTVIAIRLKRTKTVRGPGGLCPKNNSQTVPGKRLASTDIPHQMQWKLLCLSSSESKHTCHVQVRLALDYEVALKKQTPHVSPINRLVEFSDRLRIA